MKINFINTDKENSKGTIYFVNKKIGEIQSTDFSVFNMTFDGSFRTAIQYGPYSRTNLTIEDLKDYKFSQNNITLLEFEHTNSTEFIKYSKENLSNLLINLYK